MFLSDLILQDLKLFTILNLNIFEIFMKVIGIIPARGGSKSVPLKNIKKLNGKPLIEYTIETALSAKGIDDLILSTDNLKIINIAKKYKDLIIIKRPKKISNDKSSTEECLIHACKYMEKFYRKSYDAVLTLEPTSPFRKKLTIEKCIKEIKNKDIDSVVSVVECRSIYGKVEKNIFKHLFKNQSRRRQERKLLYRESSTIWGTKLPILLNKHSVIGSKPFPIIVGEREAIDINSEFDFITAEAQMKL